MGKPFTAMEPAVPPTDPKSFMKSKKIGCAIWMVLGVTVLALAHIFGPTTEEIRARKEREAADAAAVETQCVADLKCLAERHLISANSECRVPIERLGRYDSRWDKSVFEPRFSHYRWKDQAQGIVTYIGDRISFQNGFGAWMPHTYECDFNTKSRAAIEARANPGRL